MSEPKPLTKDQRESAEYLVDESRSLHSEQIRTLLAAEAYWREAVKNCSEEHGDERRCAFCFVPIDMSAHKPDCAWVLAQDGQA